VPINDTVLAERLHFVDELPEEISASMAVDLAAGRRLELPRLSRTVVRKGSELDIALVRRSGTIGEREFAAST